MLEEETRSGDHGRLGRASLGTWATVSIKGTVMGTPTQAKPQEYSRSILGIQKDPGKCIHSYILGVPCVGFLLQFLRT